MRPAGSGQPWQTDHKCCVLSIGVGALTLSDLHTSQKLWGIAEKTPLPFVEVCMLHVVVALAWPHHTRNQTGHQETPLGAAFRCCTESTKHFVFSQLSP